MHGGGGFYHSSEGLLHLKFMPFQSISIPFEANIAYIGLHLRMLRINHRQELPPPAVANTVHVMQAVGWLLISPISRLNLPFWVSQWLGVYATWQGIGAQVAATVFVIGSYFWANSANSSKPGKRQVAQSVSAIDTTSQ